MKYLLKSTDVYEVNTMDEVEALRQKFMDDTNYTLVSFGYKMKEIKQKGEVLDTYYVITVQKMFNDEKDPCSTIDIIYTYGDSDE